MFQIGAVWVDPSWGSAPLLTNTRSLRHQTAAASVHKSFSQGGLLGFTVESSRAILINWTKVIKNLEHWLRRHLFPQPVTSWAPVLPQSANDKLGISSPESAELGGCSSIIFVLLLVCLTRVDFKRLPTLWIVSTFSWLKNRRAIWKVSVLKYAKYLVHRLENMQLQATMVGCLKAAETP